MSIYYGKKTYKVVKNFIYCGETFYNGNLFDATQEDYERFKDCLEQIDNHQKPEKTEEEKEVKKKADEERVRIQEEEKEADLAKKKAKKKADEERVKGKIVEYLITEEDYKKHEKVLKSLNLKVGKKISLAKGVNLEEFLKDKNADNKDNK